MDRVELLRNARTSYAVIWTEFIKAYELNPRRVFCFFEGEDAKYYGIRVDNILLSQDRVNLCCNGKQSVLQIFELARKNPKYFRSCILFFVDRDYDELDTLPKNKKLYITPSYSIGNFYVTKNAFSRILQDELQISPTDPDNDDFARILEIYSLRLSDFIEATTELNAWLYTQIKFFNSESRLNIENVDLSKLVEVKLEKGNKLYDLDTLAQLFPQSVLLDKELFDQNVNYLNTLDKVMAFRGKYKTEFMRLFIELLKLDNSLRAPELLRKKRKMKVNLSKHNLISELSQYADTPPCLSRFIRAQAKRCTLKENN